MSSSPPWLEISARAESEDTPVKEQPELYTLQAALVLSPTNKACTTLADGDIFVVQESEHERYRLWIVTSNDVQVWTGLLDEMPEKYTVDPGKRIWEPMGIAPDPTKDYQAIETAIQALAGEMIHLRTELFIIKDMLLEKASESEQ
jgi:hypothetical protein